MQLPAFNSSLIRAAKTLAIAACLATVAQAQLTLNSVDRGRYSSAGTHILSDYDSYFVGNAGLVSFRNYTVFDTTAVTGTVTAAKVRYFLPDETFFSGSGSETFSLFNVSTSVASLSAFNVGATGIYNDLGSGTLYGSATITEASEGNYVEISLNAAFLSYINGSGPDVFAFGGALTSASLLESAYIFSGTGNPADGRTQLLLWTTPSQGEGNVAVPEPSTYGLIGAGALLAAVALRRRFAARKA